MPEPKTITPREAAWQSLIRCASADKFANLETDAALKKYGFQGSDRALYVRLTYGVIERKFTLDCYLSLLSSKPLEKLDPPVLSLLELGAYQILYTDAVPDHAAVSETVELCKKSHFKSASGFVNAVLRNLIRKKGTLPLPAEGTDERFSVEYSVAPWIVSLFRNAYGDEKTRAILSAFLAEPPITLRVNTLKTTRDALLADLRRAGIGAEPTKESPVGIVLPDSVPVSSLTALADGLCFVQDEASQLCVSALGAKKGETVYDLCACPGGKSFGLAMEMENEGFLRSTDLHESKCSLLVSGAERLGIGILHAAASDSSKPDPALFETADRVLCDVPCSGLGVIGKKPDLRHKKKEEADRLPPIQLAILRTGADYLKAGGTLVYSTCTLNPAENRSVVDAFLAADPRFSLVSDRTLFPDGGTDGFYYAVLHKV